MEWGMKDRCRQTAVGNQGVLKGRFSRRIWNIRWCKRTHGEGDDMTDTTHKRDKHHDRGTQKWRWTQVERAKKPESRRDWKWGWESARRKEIGEGGRETEKNAVGRESWVSHHLLQALQRGITTTEKWLRSVTDLMSSKDKKDPLVELLWCHVCFSSMKKRTRRYVGWKSVWVG